MPDDKTPKPLKPIENRDRPVRDKEAWSHTNDEPFVDRGAIEVGVDKQKAALSDDPRWSEIVSLKERALEKPPGSREKRRLWNQANALIQDIQSDRATQGRDR